jgi:nucleotide-binding universal stress UspA family protein
MFSRILVPLDGSARAERALPVAVRLARASGGTIHLVRVVSDPAPYGPRTVPAPDWAVDLREAERAEAVRYLAAIAAREELERIAVETTVLTGSAAARILSDARSTGSDVIVMCSHGRTRFSRWALGRVAQSVARHSTAPVLGLHEDGPTPAGPFPGTESLLYVLVPVDGSALSEAALEPAARVVTALAGPAGGALHLVYVLDPAFAPDQEGPDAPADPSARAAIRDEARAYLEGVVERLREGRLAELQVSITWSVAFADDVAVGIIRVAETGESTEGGGAAVRCDLIAMATHGRGGLQRWTMGSITERVLFGTEIPLLVVRPAGPITSSSHLGEHRELPTAAGATAEAEAEWEPWRVPPF